MTAHAQLILDWLESMGFDDGKLVPIRGDVSPRLYFRIESESKVVAVYPESERGALQRFLATTRLFTTAGIRVPLVHAADGDRGFMLLEDLGTVSVFDLAAGRWSDLRPHFIEALAALARLAARPTADFASVNPPLDATRLGRELLDARRVFLDRPEFSGDDDQRRALQVALEKLLAGLARIPLVPAHRDFMSRNLMLPPSGSVAVIDHQDACLAPRDYDLASLLNDSFFPSPEQEDELLADLSIGRREGYRRCAVQRTLKATATFIKFASRGSDRHLPLIPSTLARAAFQLERLPEGRSLPGFLFDRWRDPEALRKAVAGVVRGSRP
jgi:aminoglycoside/choline kinase family phosphotransferase